MENKIGIAEGIAEWDEIKNKAKEYAGRFEAVQQERSNYEIYKFVVGSEETPERQWRKAVIEFQKCLFSIYHLEIEFDLLQHRISKNQDKINEFNECVFHPKKGTTPKEKYLCEVRKKDLIIENRGMIIRLAELDLIHLGLVREASAFMKIIDQLEYENGETPYTYNDVQMNDSNYWRLRVEKMAILGNNEPAFRTVDMLRECGRRYKPVMADEQFFKQLPGPYKSELIEVATPLIKKAVAEIIREETKKRQKKK